MIPAMHGRRCPSIMKMLAGAGLLLLGTTCYAQAPGTNGAKTTPTAKSGTSALVERGHYLAIVGDCTSCHTARGGKPYAGGRSLPTPYGTIDSPNLTPDKATGIGNWTFEDFWNAFHNGTAPGDKLLYPVFPFTSYTKVTREDAKALFAYLKSLPPVQRKNQPPQFGFPYNIRKGLLAWRALFFTEGVYKPDPSKSKQWNRGAYLVEGLGHCNECHTTRTVLGGLSSSDYLGGGKIPAQGWYAPDLSMQKGGGLAGWSKADLVTLLKTGQSRHGAVFGPMADVVRNSTQHFKKADLEAIAEYLSTLPAPEAGEKPEFVKATNLALGKKIYTKSCASCHGAKGEGKPGIYPPLDGNTMVTEPTGFNAIRTVLLGGFPPATAGNPQPYSMPPFAPKLNNAQVAAVVNYIRQSWSNHASAVTVDQVSTNRGRPIQ